MKHIYISPHADDVALSCGGQIIANSARHSDTMVLTVFTSQTPEIDQEIPKFGKNFSKSINSFRNIEDSTAWQSLGVSAHYLNLPEALLRKIFPFAIGAYGKDNDIIDQLCTALRSITALYPDADLYFPAGFGNHVDHLACKKAAFRLLDEGAVEKITLYEDVPYAWLSFVRKPYYQILLRNVEVEQGGLAGIFSAGGLSILAYLKRRIVPFPRGKRLFAAVGLALFVERIRYKLFGRKLLYAGRVNLVGLSNDQMSKKKDLLFHYRSQIPLLFGNRPNRLLHRYYKSFATEVLVEISRRPAN